MSAARVPAAAFDLDGTLSHTEPVRGGLIIRGRTRDSYLSPDVLTRLAALSEKTDLFIATGRPRSMTVDYETHFRRFGVKIRAWILEHGAWVSNRPEWTRGVLDGIDLDRLRRRVDALIARHGLPIDADYYRRHHQYAVYLSGSGPESGERIIDLLAPELTGRFRTIVGSRKIALIPARARKWRAFQANFGADHTLCFAAGDQPDDLDLLQAATVPVVPGNAAPLVRNYAARHGNGFVAASKGHAGTIEMIAHLLDLTASGIPAPVPDPPRLPVEEAVYFSASRRAYLDRCFAEAPAIPPPPEQRELERLARRCDRGTHLRIDVHLRDWGGEIKPLMAVMRPLVNLLPLAWWRLLFRVERCGVENLTSFEAIAGKIPERLLYGENGIRISAPGVPGSPLAPPHLRKAVTLLLFDHPEDLGFHYTRLAPRLFVPHSEKPLTWFLNPMFLKISAEALPTRHPRISMAGERILMAANLVDQQDIRIAAQGLHQLADDVDGVIVAPRVISNPVRNRRIREAFAAIGEVPARLSALGPNDRPRVLMVDTYGDLPALYAGCRVTYLGGAFDARKRGFDPMESLAVGVPVIQGALVDYNRVAAEGLAGTGWITRIPGSGDPLPAFLAACRRLNAHPPDPAVLADFRKRRQADGRIVAGEILSRLSDVRANVRTDEWAG